MKYEKSCGAIIFREAPHLEFLLIFNKKGNAKGHWGFPKGHMENKETEIQTAMREVFEETGLKPEFIKGFKVITNYSPVRGINKDAIYFLAKSTDEQVVIQTSELADYRWCSYEDAQNLITFDKRHLVKAKEFIDGLKK